MSPAAAVAASPWSAPGELVVVVVGAAGVVVVAAGAVVVGAVVAAGGDCAFLEPQAASKRHARRSVETRTTMRKRWQTMRDCPLNGPASCTRNRATLAP